MNVVRKNQEEYTPLPENLMFLLITHIQPWELSTWETQDSLPFQVKLMHSQQLNLMHTFTATYIYYVLGANLCRKAPHVDGA